MRQVVIGLDTSAYRTSAAVVSRDGEVLLNSRRLLPVAEGERGLRQSDALFLHLKQMREVMEPLRELMGDCQAAAVAASVSPRGRDNSYMPVFQAGDTIGRCIAAAMNVPFFATDHQTGHIRAAAHETPLENESSFMALHLSGGTTELLLKDGNGITEIGGTLDLHAGQLVDRIGVAMGMPFPAGEELEKLAVCGESRGLLGCSMAEGDLRCHFSGAETRALQLLRDGMRQEDLAMEVYDLLSRTVARMLKAGMKLTGRNRALIAGGVASSALFRRMLTERCEKMCREIEVFFGRAEYSGDNAVGAALTGADRLREK